MFVVYNIVGYNAQNPQTRFPA